MEIMTYAPNTDGADVLVTTKIDGIGTEENGISIDCSVPSQTAGAPPEEIRLGTDQGANLFHLFFTREEVMAMLAALGP